MTLRYMMRVAFTMGMGWHDAGMGTDGIGGGYICRVHLATVSFIAHVSDPPLLPRPTGSDSLIILAAPSQSQRAITIYDVLGCSPDRAMSRGRGQTSDDEVVIVFVSAAKGIATTIPLAWNYPTVNAEPVPTHPHQMHPCVIPS